MSDTLRRSGLQLTELRVLAVDEEGVVAEAIVVACQRLHLEPPTVASTLAEAHRLLSQRAYAIVFVDDALASALLRELPRRPPPTRVIVVGDQISGRRAFDYARQGADALLDKPLVSAEVIETMDRVLHGASMLDCIASSVVGRHGLKEIQESIRTAMFTAALEQAGGNRHAAARMLGVNRRAVQLVAKDLSDPTQLHGPQQPRGFSALTIMVADRDAALDVSALERLIERRVFLHRPGIVVWRELAVQSELSVSQVFERIAALSDPGMPLRLLVDLSEASYPSAEVREHLRESFAQAQNIEQVAVVTGTNDALGVAARFVLGYRADRALSVHTHFAHALDALQDRACG